MESRTCLFCQTSFTPNKYSRRQKTCSGPGCQKKRQLRSMAEWRKKNPNYFKYDEAKGQVWIDTQRQRSKLWRKAHPDKVRAYRDKHHTEYRRYMREYMKRYRDQKKNVPKMDHLKEI